MRIDMINLPSIDSVSKDIKVENSLNSEKKFKDVLKEKNTDTKVEKTVEKVDEPVEKDANYTSEKEKKIFDDNDINELFEIMYPIVIDILNYNKQEITDANINGEEFNINNMDVENSIQIVLRDNLNSQNVNQVLETKLAETEKNDFYSIENNNNNIENNIEKNPLFKLILDSMNSNEDDNLNKIDISKLLRENTQVIKEVVKDTIKSIDFEALKTAIKNEEIPSKLVMNSNDVKLIVKNAVKEVFSNKNTLEESDLKNYLPIKHVYFKKDGEVDSVKVNEVESKDVSKLGIKNNDEELFLKSLIDGEEKITKVDLALKTDTKNFSNITESKVVEETPTIHKETMVKDVIKAIKYMEKNSQRELTVKIYPKELGEISIKIIAGAAEAGIKANITATSKETYAILTANINEMKQSIANSEIKISDVNISLYNQDTTFHRDDSNNGYENRNNHSSNNKENSNDYMDIEEIDELLDGTKALGNLSMLV